MISIWRAVECQLFCNITRLLLLALILRGKHSCKTSLFFILICFSTAPPQAVRDVGAQRRNPERIFLRDVGAQRRNPENRIAATNQIISISSSDNSPFLIEITLTDGLASPI